MKYTKKYFIEKFSAIPSEEIGDGGLDKCCALWHCGVRLDDDDDYIQTEESKALGEILKPLRGNKTGQQIIYYINDGIKEGKKFGKTPKERILNALSQV